MMLPSFFVKASAAATGFFSSNYLQSRRETKGETCRSCRRRSSSCNVAAVLLLLTTMMPQLSDAQCGCQFNHACFPDRATLRSAVNAYYTADPPTWTGTIGGDNYGLNSSQWCTGLVTNMNSIFQNKGNFDEDLSLWNTSSVTIPWIICSIMQPRSLEMALGSGILPRLLI